jgi:hypothetical protein
MGDMLARLRSLLLAPLSSDLLTIDGRPTDLLRDYASSQPEGAQHVDRH